jgi:hypothetical protein
VHDEDETRAELERLLSDPAYRQRKGHLGYRRVTREHTYAARFRAVARTIGLDVGTVPDSLAVSVIIPLDDPSWFESGLANLRRQRHAPLDAVWVLRSSEASPLAERIARADPSGMIVEVGAQAPLESMLQCGFESARAPLVTVFDPRDLYGPEFIGDLLLAMSYADGEVVGKGAYFSAPWSGAAPVLCQPAVRYRYVDEVMASAWLARRDFVQRVGFDRILSIGEDRRAVARANGCGRIYGADPYNYLRLDDGGKRQVARSPLARSGEALGNPYPDIMI